MTENRVTWNDALTISYPEGFHVLDEAEEYLHRGLVGIDLLRRIWHSSPEANGSLGYGIALLGKIQLERRIGDDEVKMAK